MNTIIYRYCEHCNAEVPVIRKFPRTTVFLTIMALLSLAITLVFFPRFIFIFIFLPFGFGLWRKAEYCALCGKRLVNRMR